MNPPALASSPLELLPVMLVLVVGFGWFVRTAWRERDQTRSLNTFFLGGRRIGAEMTEQSNWGLSFALSNGVWFFIFAGYTWGPGALLLQIPWCLSICLLILVLKPIMAASRNHTIHGFLGVAYGPRARVVACVATTIGYVLNCGYEMYWSSKIFALSLGLGSLVLPTALVLSAICGAYCMIGGYRANCTTDKQQNILGMIAISALAVCLFLGARAAVAGGTAAMGFPAAFSSSMPPFLFIMGMAVFGLFFNFFDMANWQTIAANSDLPESEHRGVKRAFVRSAVYIMFFPAAIGILMGCLLRVHAGLGDDSYFPAAFAHVLGGHPGMLRGVVLGGIMLGLLGTALSSADTYLMAALHTLSWDLFGHERYRNVVAIPAGTEERRKAEHDFVSASRKWLVPLALFMTFTFWILDRTWHGGIVAFQFIMYGSALALGPVVTLALYSQRKGRELGSRLHLWAVASILSGILSAALPFVYVKVVGSDYDTSSWAPLLALVGSSAALAVGLLRERKTVLKVASSAGSEG